MKLKELVEYISTYNKIKIRNLDHGEEFFLPWRILEINTINQYIL